MKVSMPFFCLLILFSCGQDTKNANSIPQADTAATVTTPPPPLNYPALYTDWEIGKRENVNTILSVYKNWDELSVDSMQRLFADSIVMDMPGGRRITSSRDSIIDVLVKFRNNYAKTSNQVLSVYPLRNKATNDEWVSALVYNKWIYKDNARDSMLYQDLWRLRNGKINYLLSLEQTPSRVIAKQLEKLSEKIR